MENPRILRNLLLLFCGSLCALTGARAQSSAQGKLNVQALVQGSVALVNVGGEWKVIVANAPDSAGILSRGGNPPIPKFRPHEYTSRPNKNAGEKACVFNKVCALYRGVAAATEVAAASAKIR